jgi:hypothetical protein
MDQCKWGMKKTVSTFTTEQTLLHVVKEGPMNNIFQNNVIFRIPSCSYMFRRIRSAICRKPNVILMKLHVGYVMNAE